MEKSYYYFVPRIFLEPSLLKKKCVEGRIFGIIAINNQATGWQYRNAVRFLLQFSNNVAAKGVWNEDNVTL